MKKIVLIRHGKSSWKHPVNDIDRPLKKRGKLDAAMVAEEFKKFEFTPDLVVSSPAKRAVDICRIFIKKMNISDDILHINPIIYDFSGGETADFMSSLDDSCQNVMLFGHNYAFTALANLYGNIIIENLPTSGLVVISFDIESWKDIDNGITELIIFPKQLKENESN